MDIKFHENYLGYKSKLILLSAVCLFIALSEALPKEVAILGLDLSGKPTVTGWFLVAASAYFSLLTLTIGVLGILKYWQPAIIQRLSRNLTGYTLGLTEDECMKDNYQPHHADEAEVGTTCQEFQDIQHQKLQIGNRISSSLQASYDWLILSFDFFLPIAFYVISQWYLIRFLLCANENI